MMESTIFGYTNDNQDEIERNGWIPWTIAFVVCRCDMMGRFSNTLFCQTDKPKSTVCIFCECSLLFFQGRFEGKECDWGTLLVVLLILIEKPQNDGCMSVNLYFFNGCGHLINHLQFRSEFGIRMLCFAVLSSWVQWLSMVAELPVRHVGPWSLCWTIFRASLKKLRPWHALLACVSFWSSDSLLGWSMLILCPAWFRKNQFPSGSVMPVLGLPRRLCNVNGGNQFAVSWSQRSSVLLRLLFHSVSNGETQSSTRLEDCWLPMMNLLPLMSCKIYLPLVPKMYRFPTHRGRRKGFMLFLQVLVYGGLVSINPYWEYPWSRCVRICVKSSRAVCFPWHRMRTSSMASWAVVTTLLDHSGAYTKRL